MTPQPTLRPGVYRHYKGNLYRVLFAPPWWGTRVKPLKADDVVHVAAYDDTIGLLDQSAPHVFMTALWSGNGATLLDNNEPIVIYVALYDNGRVAARTLAEFAEFGTFDGGSFGFQSWRFERIGD